MAKRNRTQKRLLIDLDGVLHKYSRGYEDGTLYDLPVDGAVDALKKLVNVGYTYVVFTTRMTVTDDPEKQRADIDFWLFEHGFPKPEAITGNKMPALAYIDDRAVRFTNWDDVRKLWT